MSKTKIVCIVGATASGKSDIGVDVARQLNGEIVSADSIQVYRQLDIGTAKPSIIQQGGIIHHLIDCVDIFDIQFSVSEYKRLAEHAIRDIAARGKLPIIVGGTGLYINALTYPLEFTDVRADEVLRNNLMSIEHSCPGKLYEILTQIDPVTAQRLHKNDVKRLIRAIEVYEISGKPLSQYGNDFVNEKGIQTEFEPIMFGISYPRELLYSRIENRVDYMIQCGLVRETLALVRLDGFSETLPALKALGYKQLIEHIIHENPATLDETIAKIKLDTRHFAKRQLTWFRRDKRITWIDMLQFSNTHEAACEICRAIQEAVNE